MFTKEAWKVPLEQQGSAPWEYLWKHKLPLLPPTAGRGGEEPSGVLHAHFIMSPGVFCGAGRAGTLKVEPDACCSAVVLGAVGLVAIWGCHPRGDRDRAPHRGHTRVL